MKHPFQLYIFNVFLLLLAGLPTLALAGSNTTIYTEENSSIPVSSSDPTFTLKLKSNPTTGYSWSLKQSDSNVIQLIKHNFQAPKKGLIGAPGFEYWTFRMKPAAFIQSQPTTIQMLYARPWNQNDNPTTVQFVIQPGK